MELKNKFTTTLKEFSRTCSYFLHKRWHFLGVFAIITFGNLFIVGIFNWKAIMFTGILAGLSFIFGIIFFRVSQSIEFSKDGSRFTIRRKCFSFKGIRSAWYNINRQGTFDYLLLFSTGLQPSYFEFLDLDPNLSIKLIQELKKNCTGNIRKIPFGDKHTLFFIVALFFIFPLALIIVLQMWLPSAFINLEPYPVTIQENSDWVLHQKHDFEFYLPSEYHENKANLSQAIADSNSQHMKRISFTAETIPLRINVYKNPNYIVPWYSRLFAWACNWNTDYDTDLYFYSNKWGLLPLLARHYIIFDDLSSIKGLNLLKLPNINGFVEIICKGGKKWCVSVSVFSIDGKKKLSFYFFKPDRSRPNMKLIHSVISSLKYVNTLSKH